MSEEIDKRWVPEVSSGFEGYRCFDCGTWVYENAELVCSCDEESGWKPGDCSMTGADVTSSSESAEYVVKFTFTAPSDEAAHKFMESRGFSRDEYGLHPELKEGEVIIEEGDVIEKKGVKFQRMTSDQAIRAGTEVFIPKGTKFKSSHPRIDKGELGRDVRLTLSNGTSRHSDELCWAGTGGYWRYCNKEEAFIRID